MEITLRLKLDEVQAVVSLLGQCPTHMGVFPLFLAIKSQAEAQVNAPPEPEAAVSVAVAEAEGLSAAA